MQSGSLILEPVPFLLDFSAGEHLSVTLTFLQETSEQWNKTFFGRRWDVSVVASAILLSSSGTASR